ncbi:MAG TPA: hypothetical protein VNM37_21540, partial [Candidatus Dormibacteraeota bacterium]|nr:hypothetical protein [Candidatus Dormibacteraeota bacterium]
SANANRWRFATDGRTFPLNTRALLAVPASALSWAVTVTDFTTTSPAYVEVDFGIPRPANATNSAGPLLVVSINGYADNAFNNWRLAWNELPQTVSDPDLQKLYSSSTVADRKGNTWVYRGPHDLARPETFSMRFYYNTLPGFFFPSLSLANQPPVGTPTPYLRPVRRNGLSAGNPAYANPNRAQTSAGNALPITYHPVWPDNVPVLQMAETLTTPKRGLPAVRGQSSLRVLYQQSQIEVTSRIVIHPDQTSVTLHDPTREKTIEFDQNALPTSIKTESSRGKLYFPALPPHLVKRFFLDPSRGANGALVFAGEFVEPGLGESYLLLNVAGQKDATTLRDLCLATDPKRSTWNSAIDGLSTAMEKFVENPAQPGSFIAFGPATTSAGLREPAVVTDDDVAVDSYALTATGPATGYVTLMAGDGEAFTPENEPVSVHIIRVVPELYRGQVNVVESENPLNEKLTLQQIVDLAGNTANYAFQWRITAPVDGQPPAIYTKSPLLFTLPPWSHVRYVQPTDHAASIETTPADRVAQDISDSVAPVSDISFTSVTQNFNNLHFTLPAGQPHRLSVGDRLVMSSTAGAEVLVTVHDLPAAGNQVVVSIDPNQVTTIALSDIFRLSERVIPDQPQSIVFNRFVVPPGKILTELWVGLDLADGLNVKVYLNGGQIVSLGLGADDTLSENPPSDLASPRLTRYFRLPASALAGASVGPDGSRTNRLAVELFSAAVPGSFHTFKVRVEGYESVDQVTLAGSVWLPLDASQYEDGVRAIVGGTA